MADYIAPPVKTVSPEMEKKDPIRVGPTKKGDKLTMYVTLPFVVSGMNVQHRNIGQLRDLATNPSQWAKEMELLRKDLVKFFKVANVDKTLAAWGIS